MCEFQNHIDGHICVYMYMEHWNSQAWSYINKSTKHLFVWLSELHGNFHWSSFKFWMKKNLFEITFFERKWMKQYFHRRLAQVFTPTIWAIRAPMVKFQNKEILESEGSVARHHNNTSDRTKSTKQTIVRKHDSSN